MADLAESINENYSLWIKSGFCLKLTTDRYGRVLGRAYVGNLDVNREMVRRGAAWVYLKYMRGASLLMDEATAKQEEAGIWSLPIAVQISPWEWRRR